MLKKLIAGIAALVMMMSLVLAPTPALAACGGGNSIRDGIDCAPDSQKAQSVDDGIRTAVNTLLFIVGVAAVIVLVVSGLRMILGAGNSQTISSARDGIIYSVIGIVVALLAYAIVNFVLGQFGA